MTDIPEDIMREADTAFIPDGEVQAEALRIAERRLLRLGWNHSPKDIGSCARDILEGFFDARRAAIRKEG